MLGLHRGLLDSGIESRILALKGDPGDDVSIVPFHEDRYAEMGAAHGMLIAQDRTVISNTHFSFEAFGISIANHPEVIAADIINLHWVADFLSSRSVAELLRLRKPVCWTLHDIRPFTGGCHFPAGCEGFITDCDPCPQLLRNPTRFPKGALSRESEALRSAGVTFIAPSRWMQSQAQRSKVAGGSRVEHMPYSINTEFFHPCNPGEARSRLNLQQECILILLGAHSFEEKRKGLGWAHDVLLRLADHPGVAELVRSGQCRLVVAGDPVDLPDLGPWMVDQTGYLTREGMRDAYSASDILFFTSQEDNLPNVIMEASACALPAVARNVGGVPDLINHQQTGWLASQIDDGVSLLLSAIVNGNRRGLGLRAREKMIAEFSPARQVESYLALYGELLYSPTTPTAENPFPPDGTLDICRDALRLASLKITALQYEAAQHGDCIRDQAAYIKQLEDEAQNRLLLIQKFEQQKNAPLLKRLRRAIFRP